MCWKGRRQGRITPPMSPVRSSTARRLAALGPRPRIWAWLPPWPFWPSSSSWASRRSWSDFRRSTRCNTDGAATRTSSPRPPPGTHARAGYRLRASGHWGLFHALSAAEHGGLVAQDDERDGVEPYQLPAELAVVQLRDGVAGRDSGPLPDQQHDRQRRQRLLRGALLVDGGVRPGAL